MEIKNYDVAGDWIDPRMKTLKVTHDLFPENEIIINGVWCDIGSHKVHEDEMHFGPSDANVCADCHDHFNDSWN